MPDQTFAERIRECPYQLRQRDGRLGGCADEYWQLGRPLVKREFGTPVAPILQFGCRSVGLTPT